MMPAFIPTGRTPAPGGGARRRPFWLPCGNTPGVSDLGQWGRSLPTDGYKLIIPRLLKAGFTRAQIDTMTKTNPARLIGLEKW